MENRVTALKAQKKNPNRINLYLDGKYAFSISRIVGAWLQVGEILSEEKIANLRRQENQEAALQKAMLLLSYRPRSEAEIRQKLQVGGFDPETIELVIERLRSNGLAEDENFARNWIENRNSFRPRSRKMLAYELRRKGITAENINAAMEEAGNDSDLAYRAAYRYARKLVGTDWESFKRRLLGFLSRRGFTYEDSNLAIQQVWQELKDETKDISKFELEDG